MPGIDLIIFDCDGLLVDSERIANQVFAKVLNEDSPLGVKGGVAAGMVVFGYAELIKPEKLTNAGAHRIFNDMSLLASEILAYVRSAI